MEIFPINLIKLHNFCTRSKQSCINGIQRCRYRLGYDAGIHMQNWHLDELFSSLDSFMDTLSSTTARSGEKLIDEVTYLSHLVKWVDFQDLI